MMFRILSIAVLLIFSVQLPAATVRVNFEVPYSTKFKRVQGNSGIKTVVEIPYKPKGGVCFGSCDQPSKDDLKSATDKVTSDANLTLWRAYLAKMPSSNISQKETEARKRVDDLVFDISIAHQVVTADKMIVFTLQGKINNNLVDQIAGFEPSEADLAEARKVAKQKVLDKYISKLDASKTSQIEKQKNNIYKRVDDLITDLSVRGHRTISDRKVVEYAIKASVNDNLFSELLFPSSEQSATGEGSLFAFLILPRVQSDISTYDATIKKRGEEAEGATNEAQSSESMTDSDSGIEEYESSASKQRRVASTTKSGSSTQQTQTSSWRLGNVQTVDAQINRYLTDSGFETVEFNDVVSECGAEELSAEGVRDVVVSSQSGTYPKKYSRMIKSALKECEVDYFGQGVMDVHSIRADRGTGGISAQVKVQITVKNYAKRMPRKVASMSKNFDGIGASQDAAIDAATEKASRDVVDIILTQIKKKGIR